MEMLLSCTFGCYIYFPCFYNTNFWYMHKWKTNVWNIVFDTNTLAKSISLYFITTMRPYTMTTKALLSHYLRTRFIVIWCKRRRRRSWFTRLVLTSAFDAFACEYVWMEDLIYDILGIILLWITIYEGVFQTLLLLHHGLYTILGLEFTTYQVKKFLSITVNYNQKMKCIENRSCLMQSLR